jgi:hypothetical protein
VLQWSVKVAMASPFSPSTYARSIPSAGLMATTATRFTSGQPWCHQTLQCSSGGRHHSRVSPEHESSTASSVTFAKGHVGARHIQVRRSC